MGKELARMFLASTILLSGCAAKSADNKPSPTQTGVPSTPTTTVTETPPPFDDPNKAAMGAGSAITTPTPVPFSAYRLATDPDNKGRDCVVLGIHTRENPQTVWGATRKLQDNNTGNSWSAYLPNGRIIVVSDKDRNTFKKASVVFPNTIVCANPRSQES